MKHLLFLLILGTDVLSIISSSLINFKVMIERITHKNALIYYNGYGCFCGKGGKGKPRDETDICPEANAFCLSFQPGGSTSRCCFNHDCCYETLHNQHCHPFIDHYRYLVINDDILCQYRNRSVCAMRACECDRVAVLCFRKEEKTYSKKYHRYPSALCKEATPKCPE